MTSKGTLGLIARRPSLTRAQFSDYWLHHHAALALPWVLAKGCVSYVQIHEPHFSTFAAAADAPPDWDIADYDGAMELLLEPPPGYQEPEKAADFFRRYVLPNEEKFLAGGEKKILRFVDARLVEGRRVVVVEGGKVVVGEDGRPVVDAEEAFRVWDEWVVEEKKDE
ncbi:hypothetical protein MMC34_003445 [Xylographa carneopallida]|nr:hypothetical protein [Xylographa carneopallida]